MVLTLPMIGIIGVFAAIFITGWLAKLNSPVIDVIAWILGIVLFIAVIVAKVAPLFH